MVDKASVVMVGETIYLLDVIVLVYEATYLRGIMVMFGEALFFPGVMNGKAKLSLFSETSTTWVSLS